MLHTGYLVVGVASALAIAIHVVLFMLIRRWMDRDVAMSHVGHDPVRGERVPGRLQQARRRRGMVGGWPGGRSGRRPMRPAWRRAYSSSIEVTLAVGGGRGAA